MSAPSREDTRYTTRLRLSLALISTALVVVAATVAWVGQREPGTSPTDSERPTGEPATAQVPSAEATLGVVAKISVDFSRNAALYRLTKGANAAKVESWLAELETLPATPYRYDVARVLYIRLAVLDPEAALDHALRGATKPAWLEAIFRTWAQIDPDAAVARAAMLDSSAKAAASRALLQLDLPLTELRTFAKRLEEPEYLAFHRRSKAIDGVAPATPTQRVLAEIAARNLARRHGESHADAWNRAIAAEDPHVRHLLAEQIALDWAADDPYAALAALDLLAVDDRVATSGDPYGSSMSVGPLRMLIRDSIIWKWAREDPNATLAWILNREDGQTRRLVQLPLSVLTGRDPDEAINLLAAIPQSFRYDATNAVVAMLARRDLDRALGFFETLDIAEQSRQARTLGRHLMEDRSAESALEWALSLDHRIRGRQVAEAIDAAHESNRTEALRLLESIDDPMRLEVAQELAWRETRRDPREALAWALGFESDAERSSLVERVFAIWSRDDPESACRALLEMRGGLLRDRAGAAMMWDVARQDTRLAERLFGVIGTPAEQARAAQTLFWHFSNAEPNPRKAARYRKYLGAGDGDAS